MPKPLRPKVKITKPKKPKRVTKREEEIALQDKLRSAAAEPFEDERAQEEQEKRKPTLKNIKDMSEGQRIPELSAVVNNIGTQVYLGNDVYSIGRSLKCLSYLLNTAARHFFQTEEFEQFAKDNLDPSKRKGRREKERKEMQEYDAKLRELAMTDEERKAHVARKALIEQKRNARHNILESKKEELKILEMSEKILSKEEGLAERRASQKAVNARKKKLEGAKKKKAQAIQDRRKKREWAKKMYAEKKAKNQEMLDDRSRKAKEAYANRDKEDGEGVVEQES